MNALDSHEDLVIQGLRARQVADWLSIVALPSFLMSEAVMEGVMRSRLNLALWFFGASLVTFGIGVRRLARGSISLLADRLVAKSWNPYTPKTVTVPLRDVRKINLNGPVVRVGFTAAGQAGHLKLRLLTPIAEELFDRLVAAVEALEENAGRIQHSSPTRVLVMPEGR